MQEHMVLESLAAPEPDLTEREMIARIVAMRPQLLDEQEAADRRGYHSVEVHEQLLRTGFYRSLQPKMFGGYEFGVPAFLEAAVELARGGPGTGWCGTLATGHSLPVAAYFSPEAQKAAFGADGDFRAPHRAIPGGTAVPVDGGYVVDGQWKFSSGVPYSTHFMGTVAVESEQGDAPPRFLVVLIPRGEYTILDDWGTNNDILGLRASGSNAVVVEKCFVPETMTSLFDWTKPDRSDATIGIELHKNPMYLGRIRSFYSSEISAVIVGAAYAALDEYERLLRTVRTRTPSQVLRIETLEHQQVFGQALAWADSAKAILLHAGETYMEYCRLWQDEGRPFTDSDDLRLTGMFQQAGRLAAETVEQLFRSADSSVVGRGDSRMGRYYRDVSMYRGHSIAQYEKYGAANAGAYLGIPWSPPPV
jgi:alkylation response protein AidB-like acyl-CoA dehydrogenase